MMPLKALKNPLRTKCCVEGCATRICSGVSMHGFPRMDRYPDLYQHWVDAIRLANKTPSWNPKKSTKVCAFHFETVENCRIRVPTVFPNIDCQVASTSKSYEDLDEDDDLAEEDYEEDPMDTYEDGIAANNIMKEAPSLLPYEETENTESTIAYEAVIDEDSAMTYSEIEERYNNIVGDVVSTLTYENVLDDDANIAYNEEEEDEPAMSYNDEEEVEGPTEYNVEEEIVYDDIYADEEMSAVPTQSLPEQIGLNQDDLGGSKYCVVVVRPESEPESTNDLTPYKIHGTYKKTTAKRSTGKRGHPRKTSGKMLTIKAAKPLPSSFDVRMVEASSVESADLPEESILRCETLQENLEAKRMESEIAAVRLEEVEGSHEQPLEQLSLSEGMDMPPGKQQVSPIKKSPVTQGELKITAPKKRKTIHCKELGKTVPSESTTMKSKEQENVQSESTSLKSKDQENAQSESTSVKSKEHKKAAPSELASVKSKEHKKAAPSESASGKRELGRVKNFDLTLDGEPIKLKACSVNIEKTPRKSNSKQKVVSAPKSKKSPIAPKPKVESPTRKEETPPSHSVERNTGDVDKMVPKGSSNFLEALSLKSSQGEENTGLRRSARIRSGGGKRRKFGTKSSWSVAFRDTPKKKRKVETDQASQSSESIPYDFEDDDPDIAISDLEGADTSVSSDWTSEAESDLSYRKEKTLQLKPLPKENGLRTVKHGRGRPRLTAAERLTSAKFHGYQRVRFGDQATQVGLPGSCDGFIFDVVRDDLRNVGVSCNIFYHYQPKRGRPSNWTRFRSSAGSASATAIMDSVKPGLPADCTQKSRPIGNPKREAIEVDDRRLESKSKYDKPIQKTRESGEHAFDAGKSEASTSRKNRHSEDTPVAENTPSKGEIVETENVYIKVEPAMVAPSGMYSVGPDLVVNAEASVESQKADEINSRAEAALAELEVKEEEELKDEEDVEKSAVDQYSLVPTDVCEVSHDEESTFLTVNNIEDHAVNDDSVTDTSSLPPFQLGQVSARNDDVVTKIVDSDDATRHEGPPEQNYLVDNEAGSCRDGMKKTGYVDESMDTCDGQAESDLLTRKLSVEECPKAALASSPGKAELPSLDEKSKASEEHVAASSLPIGGVVNSLNEAEPIFSVRGELKDYEHTVLSTDLPGSDRQTFDGAVVVGDVQTSIESNEKLSNQQSGTVVETPSSAESPSPPSTNSAESLSGADTVSHSPSQAQMLDLRKDAENVDGSLGSNELAVDECAANTSDPSSDLAKPADSPAEAEVSCGPGVAENVELSSNSEGVQASDECSGVRAGPAESYDPCVYAGTPGSRTDTENVGESADSSCILADPEPEPAGQIGIDRSRGGRDQNEDVERPIYVFSSDSSDSDSLIEVPIPEFSSDSDVKGPAAISADFRSVSASNKSSWSGKPSADADCAERFDLREPLEDDDEVIEVPVTDVPNTRTVPNKSAPFEGKTSQVHNGNSQEVFDNVERNLEKMFDMDT